jgi:hypothetical protein
MSWKLKLTEDGSAAVVNDKGHVVLVNEAGEEKPLDVLHLHVQVPSLRNEAKSHREEKEALQATIKSLKDIFGDAELDLENADAVKTWLTDATKAIKTVQNLADKDLVSAGDVEKIKQQVQDQATKTLEKVKAQYDGQLKERDEKLQSLEKSLYDLLVTNQFQTSKYVKEKLAISPAVAAKYWRDNFKVEADGDKHIPVGYFNGEKILSTEKMGAVADFDEALEFLVEKDPERDSLLQGSGHAGSGAQQPGAGGGNSHQSLLAKYEDAMKRNDVQLMVTLKRQIHQAQMASRR